MTTQGPWDRDPNLRPKAVVITGDADPCDRCAKWIGRHPIPDGTTFEEFVKEIELPPYHPNCKCSWVIEYHDARGYMTQEQHEAVLATLDRIFDLYIEGHRLGYFDAFLARLSGWEEEQADRVDEIVQEIRRGITKSCGARATELEMLFKNYIASLRHGTNGCRIELRTTGLNFPDPIGPLYFHGKIVFYYAYIAKNGNIVRYGKVYDAWRKETKMLGGKEFDAVGGEPTRVH